MAGRDAPKRGRRCELRRRVPQRLPARVEPAEVRALLAVARSARDRALLTVLWRTGQRIGDWSDEHGRHGVPGMRLGDLDHASGTVAVCLKGAAMSTGCRSAPTSGPVYAAYVRDERGLGAPEEPAWVALRRARGRPLGYASTSTSTAPKACAHRTPRSGGASPRRWSCATWAPTSARCRPGSTSRAAWSAWAAAPRNPRRAPPRSFQRMLASHQAGLERRPPRARAGRAARRPRAGSDSGLAARWAAPATSKTTWPPRSRPHDSVGRRGWGQRAWSVAD